VFFCEGLSLYPGLLQELMSARKGNKKGVKDCLKKRVIGLFGAVCLVSLVFLLIVFGPSPTDAFQRPQGEIGPPVDPQSSHVLRDNCLRKFEPDVAPPLGGRQFLYPFPCLVGREDTSPERRYPAES
jgi:hypothetical protein